MKMLILKVNLILLISFAIQTTIYANDFSVKANAQPQEIFISPAGKDSNPGTRGKPLRSIQKAVLEDIEMFENVVHGCEAGVAVSSEEGPNTKNLTIHHNLIYNNRATGIFFSRWGADNPRENVEIYNNTFYRNGWGPDFQGDIDYNLIQDINTIDYPVYLHTWLKDSVFSITGSHATQADPLFVDVETGDFRLQPGSPAINAGHPGKIYNDLNGSRNDIGAFHSDISRESFRWTNNFPPVIDIETYGK